MAVEVYEATVSGTLAGQFVQTVLHTNLDNASLDSPFMAASAIATDMLAPGGSVALFLLALPSDYSPTSLRVRRVAPTGGPTSIRLAAFFPSPTGGRTGEISSAQVNPVVVWIPTTAPAKTGRVFLPGVSEADIDEMSLTQPLITAILAFANSWGSPQTAGANTMTGCVFRRLPKLGDNIAAAYVSPLIGTQRRRLRPV